MTLPSWPLYPLCPLLRMLSLNPLLMVPSPGHFQNTLGHLFWSWLPPGRLPRLPNASELVWFFQYLLYLYFILISLYCNFLAPCVPSRHLNSIQTLLYNHWFLGVPSFLLLLSVPTYAWCLFQPLRVLHQVPESPRNRGFQHVYSWSLSSEHSRQHDSGLAPGFHFHAENSPRGHRSLRPHYLLISTPEKTIIIIIMVLKKRKVSKWAINCTYMWIKIQLHGFS